jgi:hypothetical protein
VSSSLAVWTRYRRATVTIVLAALAALASAAGGSEMGLLDGLLYDFSLAANKARPGTTDESVAVIALDRDSLDSQELAACRGYF